MSQERIKEVLNELEEKNLSKLLNPPKIENVYEQICRRNEHQHRGTDLQNNPFPNEIMSLTKISDYEELEPILHFLQKRGLISRDDYGGYFALEC
jgi:hypothetical protein